MLNKEAKAREQYHLMFLNVFSMKILNCSFENTRAIYIVVRQLRYKGSEYKRFRDFSEKPRVFDIQNASPFEGNFKDHLYSTEILKY